MSSFFWNSEFACEGIIDHKIFDPSGCSNVKIIGKDLFAHNLHYIIMCNVQTRKLISFRRITTSIWDDGIDDYYRDPLD